MEITWRVISGEVEKAERGKGTGKSTLNNRHKIDRAVKNSIGYGEAKELIGMTHGHELRGGGLLEGMGIPGRDRGKMGQLYKKQIK